jgi:hypothetical protein
VLCPFDVKPAVGLVYITCDSFSIDLPEQTFYTSSHISAKKKRIFSVSLHDHLICVPRQGTPAKRRELKAPESSANINQSKTKKNL